MVESNGWCFAADDYDDGIRHSKASALPVEWSSRNEVFVQQCFSDFYRTAVSIVFIYLFIFLFIT